MTLASGRNWVGSCLIFATAILGGGVTWAQGSSTASGAAQSPVSFMQVAEGYLNEVIYDLAFSPKGDALVAGSRGSIYLIDTKTYRTIHEIDTGRNNLSVAYSPRGTYLASGDGSLTGYVGAQTTSYSVRLWSSETGDRVAEMKGHIDAIWSVAFSPDGKLLASASRDGTVRLWEVPSGRNVAILDIKASTWSVTFSRDGLLATGVGDGRVLLWKYPWDQPVATLTGHSGSARMLAFSPDGKRLVSGSDDKTFIIWDVNTRQSSGTLTGFSDRAWRAVFLPDNRFIITASHDGTLQAWDSQTYTQLNTILSGKEALYAVAVSPDSRQLVIGRATNGKFVVFVDYSSTFNGLRSIFQNRFVRIADRWYVELTSDILSRLHLTISADKTTVQGEEGTIAITNQLGSVLRTSLQTPAEVERDGLSQTLLFPLTALGSVTKYATFKPSSSSLEFYYSNALFKGGDSIPYNLPLTARMTLTAQEFTTREADLKAAFTRFTEQQNAEKIRQEVARFSATFNNEMAKLQIDLQQWATSAVQVDSRVYFSLSTAPQILRLSPGVMRPFTSEGGPVLIAQTKPEEILRTGQYSPIIYVAVDELSKLNSQLSFADGEISLSLKRGFTHSNGAVFNKEGIARVTVPTPSTVFRYADLQVAHQSSLAAQRTFQRNQELAREEWVFRDRVADEFEAIQASLNTWVGETVNIGGKAYVRARAQDLANWLQLTTTTNTVKGSRTELAIFGGPGTAVLYSPLSRAEILSGRPYLPEIYIPLDKLAALGSSITLSQGQVSLEVTRTYERSDGQDITITKVFRSLLPASLPNFTYQQIMERDKVGREAAAIFRKAEAERKAREEKARLEALNREAVIARNPQAVANFKQRVSNVSTALTGLGSSLIWVDKVPYFAFSTHATAFGIAVRGNLVVGPDGQVGIMSGAGSAVKYTRQSVEEVNASGEYQATVYIPYNKLPTLNKNLSWNPSTLTLAYRVERKIESVTLSQVVYATRPTGGLAFTRAQVLQKHSQMNRAVASYQQREAERRVQAEKEDRIFQQLKFCASSPYLCGW